jgi:membrane-bound lytic murein transglycosylase
MQRSFLIAALLAATLSACSTQPRPDAALAASSASLDTARSAGAGELAPEPLQQAQSKLARARSLAQAGQSQDAIRLAEQAQADAELARAQASSERSRRAAEAVQASLRSLREELNRGRTALPARTTP